MTLSLNSHVTRLASSFWGGGGEESGLDIGASCLCFFFYFSQAVALDYGLNDRWFESRQGLGIFLFSTASRPDLGPTQPPIQWVPGALSLVNRPQRETDHSPPSSAEVKECV
jgi:hypothetical protein